MSKYAQLYWWAFLELWDGQRGSRRLGLRSVAEKAWKRMPQPERTAMNEFAHNINRK